VLKSRSFGGLVSNHSAFRSNSVIGMDRDVIALPNGIQAEERSGQDKLVRVECQVGSCQVIAEPFERCANAARHRPEVSGGDQAPVDPEAQDPSSIDVIPRRQPAGMRQDDAAVEPRVPCSQRVRRVSC